MRSVGNFSSVVPLWMRHPTKDFFTTKHTKATKVSDIDILKRLNFVLFVTFVVEFAFSTLDAALPP